MITAKHAKTLLALVGGWTVDELIAKGALDAVSALVNVAKGDTVDVFIVVGHGQKVEGIKAIRELTGMGLKEAKDLYEKLDPYTEGGEVGPVVTMDRDRASDLISEYGREWRGHRIVTR